MIYSLFANRYAFIAYGVIGALLGFRVWLSVHDGHIRTAQQTADNAALQAAVNEQAQTQAQLWIAAYKSSQEAVDNVRQANVAIANKDAEIQRRIAAMRLRSPNPASPDEVSAPTRDPSGIDDATKTPGILAADFLGSAAGCAADYARAATQLIVIDQLIRKQSVPSH